MRAIISTRRSRKFELPDLSKILTEEEIALVNRTEKIRRAVKTEFYEDEEVVFSKFNTIPNLHVYNYFKTKESSSSDAHLEAEKTIWKPIHVRAMDEDLMEGWVLVDLYLPYGSDLEYRRVSVDVYKDLAQYIKRQDKYLDHFNQVHAGKDAQALMDETDATATLLYSDVYQVLLGVYQATNVGK